MVRFRWIVLRFFLPDDQTTSETGSKEPKKSAVKDDASAIDEVNDNGQNKQAEKLTTEHKTTLETAPKKPKKTEIKAAPKPVEKELKAKTTTPQPNKTNIPAAPPKKPEVSPPPAVPKAKIEAPKTPAKTTSSLTSTKTKLASTQKVINSSQYQQVNANNLMVHKTHSTFLKSRQDFSQQLSEIIQLQIACAEHLTDN